MTDERAVPRQASWFVVAVGSYEDRARNRPEVENAAHRLIGLLGKSTHIVIEPPLIGGPGADALLSGIQDWGSHISSPVDTALLLWTGHADVDVDNRPQLHASDRPVTPEAVAQAIKQLENRGVRQWVVVLDCCYGYSIGRPIYQRLDEMAGRLPGSRFAVISSVDSLDEADAGLFTGAITRVLEEGPEQNWWSPSDDFVEWDAFVKRLEETLQEAPMPRTGGRSPGRIVPNPLYRPKGVSAGSFDEEHFLPKALGIEAGESGWYFTGRTDVLNRLIDWLHTSGSGFHVVTGSAGTGKSAILGRLITLSVQEYRDLADDDILGEAPAPDLGDVQLAFHARDRRVDHLLSFLAQGLGVTECRDVSDLYDSLESAAEKRGGRPYVIAVDALDEATGDHGQRMFNEVLLKVGARPGVKVLIGSRPGVVAWQDVGISEGDIVDLDREARARDDITLYIARRLQRMPDSPYAGLTDGDDTLVEVAAAVADASISVAPDGTEIASFLVARVISKTLAASPRVDTSAPGWRDRLPSGLEAAFDEDLAAYGTRHDAATAQLIRDLLQGLAWDEGHGIPRRHIPLFARAATGRVYSDEDVITLLHLAGGHITETEQRGWAMYRLYHERFREHLRQETRPQWTGK